MRSKRRHATRAEQDRETLPQLLDRLDADHSPEVAAVALRIVYGELPDRHRRPGVDPQ